MLYFPDSETLGGIDHVGYNHAVRLLRVGLDRYITGADKALFRVYCNLSWHDNAKELKATGLPLFVYTMYESTRVPSGWIRWLNKHAAAVVVPSPWCRDVYINSGLKRPLFVVSLGIDPESCPYLPKSERTETYVFMWQGVALELKGRKAPGVAVEAFSELRESGDLGVDAELILKMRPHQWTKMEILGVTTPNGIRYIQRVLTREQLHLLYRSVDCCLNPTHGEGFGLIPLEQMAMGKPVAVTGWSMPYVHKSYCFPLKYKLRESPVWWNHRHVRVGANGVSYNRGGLERRVFWLPQLQSTREDGARVIGLRPAGIPAVQLTRRERIQNRTWNVLVGVQRRLGFYRRRGRPLHPLYQEDPGRDAHVSKDDLKRVMLWCYRNRDAAKEVGYLAREHVLKAWTLKRMRDDFETIEPELRRIARCQ